MRRPRHAEFVALIAAHPDVDVNKGGTGGATPLISASMRGNHLTVKALLDNGADPLLVDDAVRAEDYVHVVVTL